MNPVQWFSMTSDVIVPAAVCVIVAAVFAVIGCCKARDRWRTRRLKRDLRRRLHAVDWTRPPVILPPDAPFIQAVTPDPDDAIRFGCPRCEDAVPEATCTCLGYCGKRDCGRRPVTKEA